MKTRARLVLEKRFRQMAKGKTLAAFSAAALLGLRLTAQSAEAQVINPCLAAYGGGSPTVDVYINDGGTDPTFQTLGEHIDTLRLSGLLDSQGKQYIDLTSSSLFPAGSPDRFRTFATADGLTSFTILPIPDGRTDPPRVFLDPGSGGVSLLVATDLIVSADSFPGAAAKLNLVLDSQDSYGTCPGGKHTYGVTMDGAALLPDSTLQVDVTGEAVVRGSAPILGPALLDTSALLLIDETTDVINLIPPGATDEGPSLIAGTPTAPLKAGGLFTGAVTESIDCGTAANLDCPLQLRNTIGMRFTTQGDLLYASGSFAAGAVVTAGTGNESLLLGATGVPFDTFNAAVANQPLRNTFEVGALVKLGALSGGINPPAEKFALRIGDFAAALDPGAFVMRKFLGIKFYTFDGLVGGFPFKVVITPLFGKFVSVLAAGHGADLRPGTAILDVTIGDDKGTTPAKVFNLAR